MNGQFKTYVCSLAFLNFQEKFICIDAFSCSTMSAKLIK